MDGCYHGELKHEMDPSFWNDWLILIGTAGAVVAAIWALAKRLRKWCHRVSGTVDEWGKWTEFFGSNPATAIHEILNDLGTATDIIELRQNIVSRKLRIGIYVCDSKGECVYASDYLAKIFGVPQASMLGLGWLAQIGDRGKASVVWEFAWKHRINYEDSYTVTNRQTGERVECRTEAFFLDSDGGRYVGYVEIIA